MSVSSRVASLASSGLSLRFIDDAVEKAFLESRAERIIWSLRVCALVAAFAALGGIIVIALFPPWNENGNSNVGIGMMVYCFIVGIVAKPAFWTRRGTFVVEWGTVAALTMLLLMLIPFQPWYLAKFEGRNPKVLGHNLLLSIDALLTSAHLFIPLRWCVIAWFEVTCILLYLIPLLSYGYPTPGLGGWFIDTIFFIVLVVLASLGKRSLEHVEREYFLRVIKERTLRAQAEFNLVEFQSKKGNASSVNSESAFEQLGMTGDLVREVEAVLALGQKERWVLAGDGMDMTGSALIGRGGFGNVVTARLHGTPIVVKMPLQPMGAWVGKDACNLKVLGNEIRLLRRLRHPNIVLFHGAVLFENNTNTLARWQVGLVLEHVAGQVLNRSAVSLQVCDFVNVAIGLCRAVRYIHALDPPIIHGDLKPSNVMVITMVPIAQAKIIDFGLSCVVGNDSRSKGGTKNWKAPELVIHPRMAPAKSLDVFALGCILYYMEVGRPAMDIDTMSDSLLLSENHEQLPWPENVRVIFGSAVRDAARLCLSIQPEDRPESLSLLQQLLEASQSIGNSMVEVGLVTSAPAQAKIRSDVALPHPGSAVDSQTLPSDSVVVSQTPSHPLARSRTAL